MSNFLAYDQLAGLGFMGAMGGIAADQVRSALRRARARAANGDPEGAAGDLNVAHGWIMEQGRPATERNALLAEWQREIVYVQQAMGWSAADKQQAKDNRAGTNLAINTYSDPSKFYAPGGQFHDGRSLLDRLIDQAKGAGAQADTTAKILLGLLAVGVVGYAAGGLAKLVR